MSRRRPAGRVVLVGLLVLAGLAGCGPSTGTPSPSPTASQPPAPPPGTVCGLVPDADVLIGRAAIGPPAEFTIGVVTRCTWIYGTDPSRSMSLNLSPLSSHADTIAAFGAGGAVADLGDDARWWPTTRTISVAVGDRSFQIDFQLEAADVTRDLAIAIARSALEHLG